MNTNNEEEVIEKEVCMFESNFKDNNFYNIISILLFSKNSAENNQEENDDRRRVLQPEGGTSDRGAMGRYERSNGIARF